MQSIDHYKENSVETNLDELVKMHSSLVMKIAKSIKRKLPSTIEFDDLVQAGFVGLIEASKTFKTDQGTSFDTFASIRVKGSILDYLRKNSISNREILKNIKALSEAISKLEQKHLRPASAIEIAEEMKISIDEYNVICQYININHATKVEWDLEGRTLPSDSPSPEDHAIEDDLKVRIKKILVKFPEREQILLSLYYIEELTFKEISEVLNLTEARVCQLHAAAIAKLSRILKI